MRNKNEKDVSMPGYKQTTLGWIPEEWQIKKLNQIADIKTGPFGAQLHEKDYVQVGTPIITVEHLGEPHIIHDNLPKVSAIDKQRLSQYVLKTDDIVFSRVGSVDRNSLVSEKENGWLFSGRLLRVRVKSEINPAYLSYFFHKEKFKQFIRSIAVGQTMPSLNTAILSGVELFFPSRCEQEAIVSILRTWDVEINKLAQIIQLNQQRRKALMQQLLTGKKRLPGFRGEWKQHTYNDIIKEVRRPSNWNDDELYHLISVRRRSGGIFERENLFGHQIKVKDLRTANEGDFLFSKMQIVHGASALVTKEFDGTKISGSYIAVVAKDNSLLDMNFFNWWSKSPLFYHQTYISSYGVHIEKMTFDFESFLSLGMNLPEIQEQKAIAKVLQTGANEIQLLQKKLNMLKEQKKGLMQQLLTGKKRVKL